MQIENTHVDIQSNINQHSAAKITAMIKAGVYDDYLKIANSAKRVTIRYSLYNLPNTIRNKVTSLRASKIDLEGIEEEIERLADTAFARMHTRQLYFYMKYNFDYAKHRQPVVEFFEWWHVYL